MSTNTNKDSVEFFSKFAYRDILANLDTGLYIDAELCYILNLLADNFFGKAVFGYSHLEHTTRLRKSFEYNCLMSLKSEVMSRDQSCRSCSYYGNALSAGFDGRNFKLVQIGTVTHKSLEFSYG